MRTFFFFILFTAFIINAKGQSIDSSDSPLHTFTYNNIQTGIQRVTYDTLIDNFQDFMPFRSYWVNSLGNNGSATFPLQFNYPDENIPYIFKPWHVYFGEDRNMYYHTRKPYSNIKFAAGSSKDKGEQAIQLTHTQNINSKLNVSAKAASHNAIGSFLRQENRLSCFRISTNYIGDKYKLFANLSYEKFKLTDNGGIVDDSYLIDSLYEPENLSVNLTSAKNTLVFKNGSFHQIIPIFGKTDSIDSLHTSYKSIFEIHHGIKYQWVKKTYTDKVTSFYNDYLIDSTATHDSLHIENLTQDLSLVLTQNNPLHLAFLAGTLYNQQDYYFFYNDTTLNSFGVQASIFKIREKASSGSLLYESWLSGYKKGNTKIEGNFSYLLKGVKDTITFSFNGGFWNKKTEYFENSMYINNYKWENDFVNSAYSKVSLSVYDKRFKTGITLTNNTVKNYIYYVATGNPMQHSHTIQVMSAEIYKNFTWKKLHFNNRVLVQQSSNDSIMPLPMFVGVHSLYFQFLAFKKVLKVQLGAEVYFFTKYFAPRYIPATAQFALQNERETGDYPFTDVFINLHLKRACLFLKLEHANYSLSSANYFYTPHYPIAPRTFKFGVSWNFYD